MKGEALVRGETPDDPGREARAFSVAFVGTYVPRQCGIATFTRDVAWSVARESSANPDLGSDGRAAQPEVQVIALDRVGEECTYPAEVRHQIAEKRRSAYVATARALNGSGVDVVSLQHEFGIFGGRDGSYVLDFVRALTVPVVPTLHTVTRVVQQRKREILRELCARSARVVAMTEHSRDILVEAYGVDPRKVAVIPHGVPDIPFTDPELVKPQLGLEGGLVILNFGLLEPRKRIELVIDALARIADRVPDFSFVVLGATHPRQRRVRGEAYRESLRDRAARAGLSEHVLFVDRYVDLSELTPWLVASDIFVTPYRDRQQMVSGTLAYAVAAGKVVISTPYPHAVELLSGGAGLLTPFGNVRGFAENLYAVLTNPSLRGELRASAYARSRSMIWPEVGKAYRELFREVASRA